MGVSYAFTTQGGCPDAAAQFGGQELETNGFCWQVPLLGGRLDKVFASPATLTVQKLGTLYTAHPDITLPDWASYTTLTIQTAVGSVVFAGSVSEYQSFLFPANGEYKAEMTLWRVPKGGMATQFEGGSTGALRKNLGLERPAKPTGWYRYSFRFTLQASADIAFSVSEETRDETLRRQINERLDYEKKAFEIFIHNQTGKYIYVVENMEYESCGFFIDYNRALKYAKKYMRTDDLL